MNLEEYKLQRELLEESIGIAVRKAVKEFQKATDHCPSEIRIKMIDVTGFVYGQNKVKWRLKKHFEVGQVHAIVEI